MSIIVKEMENCTEKWGYRKPPQLMVRGAIRLS